MGNFLIFTQGLHRFDVLNQTLSVIGILLVMLLAVSAVVFSLSLSRRYQKLDRGLFWVIGVALFGFAVLRPIGLARDDLVYVEMLKNLCPGAGCGDGSSIERDHVWFGLVKLGLYIWPANLRVALVLSGLGVLIKLFVIDRLCRQRVLALLLFIPLCYVQYDLTQLRAGLAISWMLLGVYALVRSHLWVGAGLLCANFMVHFQAIFSPVLLFYKAFSISRWALPVFAAVALILIYAGLYPSVESLSWLGHVGGASLYYAGSQNGAYVGVKVFPWGYLLILAYGIWVCDALRNELPEIVQIVSMGLALGMLVAWFFAINPTIQTRVFEFYAVPLVLLAGNVGTSRTRIVASSVLGLVLYFRLELLHDWILG